MDDYLVFAETKNVGTIKKVFKSLNKIVGLIHLTFERTHLEIYRGDSYMYYDIDFKFENYFFNSTKIGFRVGIVVQHINKILRTLKTKNRKISFHLKKNNNKKLFISLSNDNLNPLDLNDNKVINFSTNLVEIDLDPYVLEKIKIKPLNCYTVNSKLLYDFFKKSESIGSKPVFIIKKDCNKISLNRQNIYTDPIESGCKEYLDLIRSGCKESIEIKNEAFDHYKLPHDIIKKIREFSEDNFTAIYRQYQFSKLFKLSKTTQIILSSRFFIEEIHRFAGPNILKRFFKKNTLFFIICLENCTLRFGINS